MMNKMKYAVAIGTMVLLAGQNIQAQEVKFENGVCPFTIKETLDGEGIATEVQSFYPLGQIGEDYVAVLMTTEKEPEANPEENSQEGEAQNTETPVQTHVVKYVSLEEFTAYVPKYPLEQLPKDSEKQPCGVGNNGEYAKGIQQQLIDAGYLSGDADGLYGGGTAGAISSLQTAYALEATGNADIVTQWILDSLSDTGDILVQEYPPVYVVEEKFEKIYQNTDADLEPYLDPSWQFSYDVYAGEGTLGPYMTIGTYSVETPAIDKIDMKLTLGILVTRDAEEKVQLKPMITLKSVGAFCPNTKMIQISNGTNAANLEAFQTNRYLEGSRVCEETMALLDAQSIELLKQANADGFTLRVSGKGGNYDMTLSDNVEKLQNYLENCGKLIVEEEE